MTVAADAHHVPRPFNTPLECGLRLLFVLAATAPRAADLQRLISYDYLLVHSGDVPDGPQSLHPAMPFRGSEWLVRRDVVARGLDLMFARELVSKEFMPEGIFYAGNDLSRAFVGLLRTAYARELGVRASWIAERFTPLSDGSLTMFMTENVGRWGAEFDRLTALPSLLPADRQSSTWCRHSEDPAPPAHRQLVARRPTHRAQAARG